MKDPTPNMEDIRIEETPGQEISIIHRRECDECGGTGEVEVFACRGRHPWPCHDSTCRTVTETCEARGCDEGWVDDDECACVRCQAEYDAWLERDYQARQQQVGRAG